MKYTAQIKQSPNGLPTVQVPALARGIDGLTSDRNNTQTALNYVTFYMVRDGLLPSYFSGWLEMEFQTAAEAVKCKHECEALWRSADNELQEQHKARKSEYAQAQLLANADSIMDELSTLRAEVERLRKKCTSQKTTITRLVAQIKSRK